MSPRSETDNTAPTELHDDRPLSASPLSPGLASPEEPSLGTAPSIPANLASPAVQRVLGESGAMPHPHSNGGAEQLNLMPNLLRSGPSVVKTRQGSVLSRGFILKTDYWPSGELPATFIKRETSN
jgi:hypothetical protein